MKSILTTITLSIFLIGFANNAAAQKFGFGAGVAYGTDIEEIGIQAGVLYSITNEIRSGVDVVYYMTDSNLTWIEINANGHYGFVNTDDLFIYGLAGVNYVTTKVEVAGFSATGTDTGVNLGAGLDYSFGAVGIYTEVKYALTGNGQVVASGGVRFFF